MIERIYYRVKLNTDQIIYAQHIDIAQEMGTSTTKVMSQNAVTTAINTTLESRADTLEAKLNENIIKNPDKTYLVWKGDKFPNSSNATFKAPKGCTIDWGDGNVETFETASTEVNTHNYTDGIEYHLISLSNYTLVGDGAFLSCSGLTSITIGNSVISIGEAAFRDCIGLTSVIWNAKNCTSAGSSSYPIFSGCSKLTNVTIGENVKTIPSYAFGFCTGLTNVTIGDGVTSIENNAFYYCRSLKSITIPDSVTSIGGYAFDGCAGLKTIRISAINPPTLGSNAFETSLEKIIVPKSAINTYKSADGWSTYADKIVYEVDSSDIDLTAQFDALNIKNGTGLGSLVQKYVKNDVDYSAQATGENATAFGGLRFDYDPTKHSGDTTNTAAGGQSFVAGCGNYTAGDWSFVTGKDNTVYSNRAFVSGGANISQAIDDEGNFIKEKTNAGRFNAIFGNNNTFKSSNTLKESNLIAGGSNTVDTERSIVVGHSNNVTGHFDAIFGSMNQVNADYSLTGGKGHVVNGGYHLVAGSGHEVSGQYDIASGQDNKNLGWNSAVIGRELIVGKYHTSQTVLGQYNDNKSDTVLEIGWGNPDNRKNVFEVLQDGRAKVQSAPVDTDDVVRKLELDRKFDKSGGTVTGDMVVGGDFTVQGKTTTVDIENLRVTDKLIEVGKGNAAPLTSPAGLITPKYDGTNNGGIVYDHTGTAYVGDITLDSNGNVDVNNSDLQPIATRNATITNGNLVKWDSTNHKLVDAGQSVENLGNVEVDNRTITKTTNEEIQAVALTNGTDLLTYADILQATTIERL